MPARRRHTASESDPFGYSNSSPAGPTNGLVQPNPFVVIGSQQAPTQQHQQSTAYQPSLWRSIATAATAAATQYHRLQLPKSRGYVSDSPVSSNVPSRATQHHLEGRHLSDDDENDEDIFEITIMTARDRTAEFANTIQTLQGRNIARAVAVRDPRRSKALQNHSEFMLFARNVGKNIASTYNKLEKLTLLAKRKSLFDDRSAEIQELTYIIKGDLGSLNTQIGQLQEVSKSQRNLGGRHLQSHSSNMVLALQSKLATMSTDFKQILEVRTENLRQQKHRMDQFSHGDVNSSLPPSVISHNQGSVLLSQQDDVTIDFSGNETTALIPRGQMQAALLQDETDNYLHSRAETMQNIESTIVELGGIFQQLAHMVKEQEEMVDRIDSNVQDAEINIDAAHTQILKYFQSVRSNRWLMIKIFGVLIFFFLFFIVFMA